MWLCRSLFCEGWWFCAIFSFHPPILLLPPPPLLPSSSSPLHFSPSLYYSKEGSSDLWNTPVHTGINKSSQFTSTPHVYVCACVRTCVCVCQSLSERKQERWSDSTWQTGFVIQYFKLLYIPPTPTCPSHLFTAAFSLMEATGWIHEFTAQSPE